MKVQSIGHYYVPKYNNIGRISTKQNDVTFKAEDYPKRAIVAYYLLSAKRLLQEKRTALADLKEKDLTNEYTDYTQLEKLQNEVMAQKELVMRLTKEYSQLNPSEQEFYADAETGRQHIENYRREHGLKPFDPDKCPPYSINLEGNEYPIGVQIGEFPWYNPS